MESAAKVWAPIMRTSGSTVVEAGTADAEAASEIVVPRAVTVPPEVRV